MQFVGFAQRAGDLVAVGIAFLYYVNARERIQPRHILRGFAIIWFTVIILGTLATFFPDVRITTPMSLVMPGSLMGNELVHELVVPRLAEVQEPWGAEEPFVRPAAPFPYTNSWGMAYAMLTPFMVLLLCATRSLIRRIVLGFAMVISLYPAMATSNRGMMIALAIFAGVLALRFLVDGRRGRAAGILGALLACALVLYAAGAFKAIAERQEVSDTTSGRGSIYLATIDKVMQSPLVGWATPGMDATIGIALGTQGYAWTLMYSYGFVGLAIFGLFLGRIFTASFALRGSAAFVMQALIAAVGATIWFYGLGVTQCLILLLSAAMLSRATADDEGRIDV
jgi:hypothetical protein